MANELQTKLDTILEDKNTNLLPENLKAGVTCLGVNGNFNGTLSTVKSNLVVADYSKQLDASIDYKDYWTLWNKNITFRLPFDVGQHKYLCGITPNTHGTYDRWLIITSRESGFGSIDFSRNDTTNKIYGSYWEADKTLAAFKFNEISDISVIEDGYGSNELGIQCELTDLPCYRGYREYQTTEQQIIFSIDTTAGYIGQNYTESYHTPNGEIMLTTDMLRLRNVIKGTSVYSNLGEHNIGTLDIPSNIKNDVGVQLSLENTVDYRELTRDTNFIFYIGDIQLKKYYILYEQPYEMMPGRVDHETYLITSDEPLYIKSDDYYHGGEGSSTQEHWMQIFQTIGASVDIYRCEIDTYSEGLEGRTFITMFTSEDIDWSIISLSDFKAYSYMTPSSDGYLTAIHVSGNGVIESNSRLVTNCAITKLDDNNIVILNEIKDCIDTSDANATVNDIVDGKTAYVNGEKITGTLTNINQIAWAITDASELEVNTDIIRIIKTAWYNGVFYENTDYFDTQVTFEALAQAIGLTADKIKAGEIILGITGTYTGEDVSL